MQGILVHGANHFIVRGPLPDLKAARRLVRLWEIPELGRSAPMPPRLPWQMVNKAFREDLAWAVVLEGSEAASPAVAQLLAEMDGRGVRIQRGPGPWGPEDGDGWVGDRFPEFVVQTPRLAIREMTQSDAEEVERMLGDPEVMLYFGKLFGRVQVREWIERHIGLYAQDGCAYWLVIDKASGEAVGQAGILRQQVEGQLEFGLGYIFKQAWWRRGLALEAARACLDYAFDRLRKNRVIITVRPENGPSRRLAERLGVKPERTVQYGGFEHLMYVVRADERQYQERQ